MVLTAHWNGCLHFLVSSCLGFPDRGWIARTGIKAGYNNYLRRLDINNDETTRRKKARFYARYIFHIVLIFP